MTSKEAIDYLRTYYGGEAKSKHCAAIRLAVAEIERLRARVAAICDRLEIDPQSPIDPVVSRVLRERDQLQHGNRQQQEKIDRQDERILKLQQRCLSVRDAANKLCGTRPRLQKDCDDFERLVGQVNAPDLLELPETIKRRLDRDAEQQTTIDQLRNRDGALRDASSCPPDSDLLTWVRMLSDDWMKRMGTEAAAKVGGGNA